VRAEFMGFEQQLQPSWLARDSERIWRGSYKNKAWKHLVSHSSTLHMHSTCSIPSDCSSLTRMATAAVGCVKFAMFICTHYAAFQVTAVASTRMAKAAVDCVKFARHLAATKAELAFIHSSIGKLHAASAQKCAAMCA